MDKVPLKSWCLFLLAMDRYENMYLGYCRWKTVLILGLRVLVHQNQTWTFPINDITIKVSKYTRDKHEQFLHISGLFPVF